MDRKGLTELIGKVQGCGRRAINETETVVVQNEQIADYLIANGIGDISEEKHRADVAEEALRICAEHNFNIECNCNLPCQKDECWFPEDKDRIKCSIEYFKQQAEQRLKEQV